MSLTVRNNYEFVFMNSSILVLDYRKQIIISLTQKQQK